MAYFGYNKPLFILPFDHRASFSKTILGISGEPSLKDKERIIELKQIIYDAFKVATASGVPKDEAAILVDEEYGGEILKDASAHGFVTCLTTEKSGQDVFDFEYEDFKEHIRKIKPTFIKVLVRYNPGGDKDKNKIQLERIKILSDFAHSENYKFLIEPLILPTVDQLYQVGDSRDRYDKEMRPLLTIDMIKEFHLGGIEPDIWKIEGMWKEEEYKRIVKESRNSEERSGVGVIILGRGENRDNVEKWIVNGRNVSGVIGFAVGRTIFFEPLVKFKDGKISKDEAIDEIANNYKYFYNLFTRK